MSKCRCRTCGGSGVILICESIFPCPDCDGHGWEEEE